MGTVATIISSIIGSVASAVGLGLSSFGVYSLLLETGRIAPIVQLEALF
ncbi:MULTISPECIES: hypothetical protein [Corynebacterium]|nr:MULTISPECIES: hypothetical protein [Corynebacterium]MBE7339515.1 hypothetical protein [Corynebacterium aurimucosum]MBE7365589.1 hypothetical protein [Corynebacterium aurimucosum]HCT9179898.1 hypothetical protein [Corynebacterium aurimucosum]